MEIADSPYSISGGPDAVALTPSGQYAYVTLAYSNEVAAFSINPSSGALTQISGSPFAAGNGPADAIVDPSGKFLYVGNQGESACNISAYKVNASSGRLTTVKGSPFTTGKYCADVLAIAVPH
jgi:6-phosphogluconolactonase